MSELTSTLKKAVPIIAVTWILSMITTLAVVYFAPNIFPKTWHEVARFEGTTAEETPDFYVPSINWRIIWSVDMEQYIPEDARIKFYLIGYQSFLFREFIPKFRYEDGEEYLTGSGSWSIAIVADGLAKWHIIVEAYY